MVSDEEYILLGSMTKKQQKYFLYKAGIKQE